MSRRPRMLAAGLALVVALAGCVGLPDSGDVHAGQVPEDDGQGDALEFIAERPAPGASQEEIVLGFLQAAITATDDFDIARSYLTDSFADEWDPTASVSVRTGQPTVTETGEDTLDVAIDVAGQLDEHGIYSTVDAESTSLGFELIADDGEWRIATGPDGIVLTAYYFERLFESQSLSWLSLDRTWGVPDVRWFPSTDDAAADRIVDAVLAGPADWLAPAVWTAAADDVRRTSAVTIDDGTATVRVSGEQAAADAGDASTLALQLLMALSSADIEVTEVVLESDGFAVTSTDAQPLATSNLDARPIGLVDGQLVALGSGPAIELPAGPVLGDEGATDAVSLDDGTLTAALAGDEVLRIVAGGDPDVLDDEVAVPPSLDRFGWIWWVDAAGTLQVSDGDRTVSLGVVDEGRVLAIDVSRDGSRIAIVTSGSSVSHVRVVGVVRDGDGVPTSITSGVTMPDVAGTGQDVTWTGPETVAVLSDAEDGSSMVHAEVGGESMQLPAPPQLVTQLVGGDGGIPTLRARGVDGVVLSIRGGTWQASSEPYTVDLILSRV